MAVKKRRDEPCTLGGYFNDQTLKFARFGKIKEFWDPRCCLCDFDFKRSPRMLPMMAVLRVIGIKPVWIRYDRTRRGWHVVIKLNHPLEPAEMVALQLAMGSDGRREALNLMRVIALRIRPNKFWGQRWNILFERKLK